MTACYVEFKGKLRERPSSREIAWDGAHALLDPVVDFMGERSATQDQLVNVICRLTATTLPAVAIQTIAEAIRLAHQIGTEAANGHC